MPDEKFDIIMDNQVPSITKIYNMSYQYYPWRYSCGSYGPASYTSMTGSGGGGVSTGTVTLKNVDSWTEFGGEWDPARIQYIPLTIEVGRKSFNLVKNSDGSYRVVDPPNDSAPVQEEEASDPMEPSEALDAFLDSFPVYDHHKEDTPHK